MVKPSHTFSFLFSLLAVLAILMLVFPKDGIKLSSDVCLNFPNFHDWFSADTVNSKSNEILKSVESDLALIEEDTLDYVDVEIVDSSVFDFKPRKINTDEIRQPLDLPISGVACLETLFKALMNPNDLQHVVRIMHYGDSQIEADRISGYLRYKLQQQFGGSGPGFIPAKTAYDYKSPCAVENFGDWKRYTIFPKIDTAVKHSRYGILGAFCMFGPMRKVVESQVVDSLADSLEIEPNVVMPASDLPSETYTGSLSFVPSTIGRQNIRNIYKVRMMYGNCDKPFDVNVYDGESVLYNDRLRPADFYTTKLWNFSSSPSNLRFEFSAEQSPEIYGFALDGLSGVAVDNIPLRGCSGTIFTKMNGKMLAQMYKEFNVKCVILQFGGNAVPALDSSKVKGFAGSFAAQIRYIKKLCPDMSIIVVGPADMSMKVQDHYETYGVLPYVVDELKRVSLNNNCAFWNMYEAMGGWNTMPDWVYHEPALAEKDFIHLNPNGANVMARMFYSAIISRYNEFLGK